MRRSAIAFLVAAAMVLMGLPGQVAAHQSTATDLNDQAYDNVWPLLGPGGVTSGVDLPREAIRVGGNDPGTFQGTPKACSHHDDGETGQEGSTLQEVADRNSCDDGDVETVTAYQCTGPDPDNLLDPTTPPDPNDNADIRMYSNKTFPHSDLENGIIESTGSFFVPFEFGGEDASEVSQVWFGFAETLPWPASSTLCQWPFPEPGSYYEFYRGDTDGSDGWEIPINTLLVPDAPYGAIVRALDAAGNTLAASFVYANVNNYLNDAAWQPSTPSTCDQSSETGETLCPYHDTTPPRATIVNADQNPRTDDIANADGTGDRTCNTGVAVEYGEPLADFEVLGGDFTFEYNAPDRDVDSAPLTTVGRDNWGPAFCFETTSGIDAVKAWDQSGNIRIQELS